MDYELIKMALMALNMLMTLALWLFALNDRKQRATTQSIKELERHVAEKFDDKCARIAKVEADLKAMPTRDELIRIHQRIDELNDNSKETNLLLGQLIGQIKQMNGGH